MVRFSRGNSTGEEASYEMSNEEVKIYKESLTNKKESKLNAISHRVQAYLPRMLKSSDSKKSKNPEVSKLENKDKLEQANPPQSKSKKP